MICRDIMKRDVAYVDTLTTVLDAARKMRDVTIGILPVFNHERAVIGVVTDWDITTGVVAAGAMPEGIPVDQVMSTDLVACRAEDDIHTALKQLVKHRKSRILVVDGQGHLSGIISVVDIIGAEEAQRHAA